MYPILSNKCRETILALADEKEPIACEIKLADSLVADYLSLKDDTPAQRKKELESKINDTITDEVSMISIRMDDEILVSYLPKGKNAIYNSRGEWSRQNRQTARPAKIFKKLLIKEFTTYQWEKFSNRFKSKVCGCDDLVLVEGEDIRYWYDRRHYYTCEGSLGNSCMRYEECASYFDIYVDHAKMLISTKDGLLTGRAIVWKIGEDVIMDRVYTCYDYLYDCFASYAKERGWWIRETNSLLSTGDQQTWLNPNNKYAYDLTTVFTLNLNKSYDHFPYMDSFRYYNDTEHILSTSPEYDWSLDSTDGEMHSYTEITCNNCGAQLSENEALWSEWADAYFCEDCVWWCGFLDDWIPNYIRSVELRGERNECWEIPYEHATYLVSDNQAYEKDGTFYLGEPSEEDEEECDTT